MGYKDLEVWKLSDELVTLIHDMTMMNLPDFEKFELGRQIRRSAKSVQANIVEGYGRKVYQQQYFYFLVVAQGSLDETRSHLETLRKTNSLKDEQMFIKTLDIINLLGRKLYHLRKKIHNDLNSK